MLHAGRYAEAIRACSQAIAINPNQPLIRATLGSALMGAGRADEAVGHLRRAARELPRHTDIARVLAAALMYAAQLDEAALVLDRALRRSPGDADLLLARARWATLTGKPEFARAIGERVIKSDPTRQDARVAAGYACEQIGTSEAIEAGISMLEPIEAGASSDIRVRATGLFQLARLLEMSGRYERAIGVLHKANGLLPHRFDGAGLRGAVDRMLAEAQPEATERQEDATTPVPLFIVGMPRTGSTLVEGIIGAHPDAATRGETGLLHRLLYRSKAVTRIGADFIVGTHPHNLLGEEIESIRGAYFERSNGEAVCTDKDLHNFLHLGLIARIFPEARIIRCTRDALDTCLSCYSHCFMSGVPYAQRFADLAAFSRLEERVSAHWAEHIGLPILDVSYEELVRSPEAVEHEIVRFSGLSWDERCAEPHKYAPAAVTSSTHQVRKPIYRSSVSRADRFGSALDSLRAALRTPDSPPDGQMPAGSGWIADLPTLTTGRRRA